MQEKAHKMKVEVLTDFDLVKDLGYQGDHAGKWESSIFWHYYPDYVDMGRFKQGVPLREQGVGGENPYETASREVGRTIAEAIVERTAQRALDLLAEARQEA
jgi:creatinine amidohydrolase/Fe(II)-dependent formamide hydrolase-like protein